MFRISYSNFSLTKSSTKGKQQQQQHLAAKTINVSSSSLSSSLSGGSSSSSSSSSSASTSPPPPSSSISYLLPSYSFASPPTRSYSSCRPMTLINNKPPTYMRTNTTSTIRVTPATINSNRPKTISSSSTTTTTSSSLIQNSRLEINLTLYCF